MGTSIVLASFDVILFVDNAGAVALSLCSYAPEYPSGLNIEEGGYGT